MGNEQKQTAGSTRRDFLKASGLGAVALNLGQAAAFAQPSSERSVILLMMVGGPSQLETFDPKPGAPSDVRGPFGSIETALPGVRINEYLPRIAQRMDRLALIRTMHHDAAPIHETGCQLLQTGRLCRQDENFPHFGAVAASELGRRGTLPSWAIVPAPIGATGVQIPNGQSAAGLGSEYEPFVLGADAYGHSTFGHNCLLARKLIESGVRVVTVNMFETVFRQKTWDCHGRVPFSTLADYRDTLLPAFDAAFCALLDDLDRVGRLENTLVVATGEFGRTPKLNNDGGRDHWPAAWSALVAGGGIAAGQVIGQTDAHASEPVDRPVRAEELFATMTRHLGMISGLVEGFESIAELNV